MGGKLQVLAVFSRWGLVNSCTTRLKWSVIYILMNMKFTPATLVLALSATPVALAKVDANGAGGLASNRFSGGDGEMMKATPSRASERMLMLPLDAPDGTGGAGIAGSSEIDVADTGILRLRRLSRTSIHVNDSGRMRSLQEDEATCVKPDTCEPSLCSCVANGGDGYDCATELNAVCNNVTAADGTVSTPTSITTYTVPTPNVSSTADQRRSANANCTTSGARFTTQKSTR